MENKLKHLDFLQLVITRMSVNSFLIKGWVVTVVAAMFAFAAKDSNAKYGWITLIVTLVFWILDGYYLSQERQYRALYNVIRVKVDSEIDFNMDASMYNKGKCTWLKSSLAFTLVFFYMTVVSLSVAISIIIN